MVLTKRGRTFMRVSEVPLVYLILKMYRPLSTFWVEKRDILYGLNFPLGSRPIGLSLPISQKRW